MKSLFLIGVAVCLFAFDTTQNLARFVQEAGDSLWNTKDPGHLERVDVGKKP